MNYVTTTINNLNNHGLANKTREISKSAEKKKRIIINWEKNKKTFDMRLPGIT